MEPSGDHAGLTALGMSGASSTGSDPGPSTRNRLPSNPDAQQETTRRAPSGDQYGWATVSMPSVTATTEVPRPSITYVSSRPAGSEWKAIIGVSGDPNDAGGPARVADGLRMLRCGAKVHAVKMRSTTATQRKRNLCLTEPLARRRRRQLEQRRAPRQKRPAPRACPAARKGLPSGTQADRIGSGRRR